jgi:hypothetical protein
LLPGGRSVGSLPVLDRNAVFRMPVAYRDLATDYVHLSVAGQRRIAEVTWRATFPFGR